MDKLDELKNKAKAMLSGNRDKIEGGLEKAGDLVNQKTGGKYGDKIDKGLAKAREGLDRVDDGAGTSEGSADSSPGAGLSAGAGMSEGAGISEPEAAAAPPEQQATPPTTPPPSGPPMG